LVAVAAEEAVEILETKTVGPQIERTRLARHPVRHVVHLSEPRRIVAVLLEDLADGARALGDDRVIARIARRKFGDDSGGDRMMVAAGNQRGARWRAERGGVIHVVAKTGVSEALEVGSLDWSAEGAAGVEANVVR
jgi:hypothetical protein